MVAVADAYAAACSGYPAVGVEVLAEGADVVGRVHGVGGDY